MRKTLLLLSAIPLLVANGARIPLHRPRASSDVPGASSDALPLSSAGISSQLSASSAASAAVSGSPDSAAVPSATVPASGSVASSASTSLPSGTSGSNSTSTATNGIESLVIAHFIMGNAAPYNASTWASDVKLASSKGLDGFILNLGTDSWQPAQVALAFAAAKSAPSKFYIGFSFDMTVMPCANASGAALLQAYIANYTAHPNVLRQDGKMLISTFSGEKCTFGKGSVDEGWAATVKNGTKGGGVHFVPAFFVDPATLKNYSSIDGVFNWNGAWPQSQVNTSFTNDTLYTAALSTNQTYLAAVSPWFFTHYGADSFNKNWIYDFDNWLFSARWEVLIQNRDKVQMVEVITWNDYGESHYVGPIGGAQPNSQAWVDGFDHQGWLDIMQYYIEYYKAGTAPKISQDRIFLWAKLYATNATAPNDKVGPPRDADWATDTLWAQFHLAQPADLTLACGPATQTFKGVPAGVSKQRLPLAQNGCQMSANITRSGKAAVSFEPNGMNFSTMPTSYNFNAFVAASPANVTH